MTIQGPPNDETPPPAPNDTPDTATGEPEQRAPGMNEPPMGAPRDEPDPDAR